MKYITEERLDIGRRIYDGESARDYMRLYRDANHLPPKNAKSPQKAANAPKHPEPQNLEDLEAMTKEQLIQELVKARIAEAR